jgi:hypothetical protein
MDKEENISKVKDVIDATTGLVKAVPIYKDLVQPAAKEIGTALGTIAKAVNVALVPISGMIWSYETIKDFVATKVSIKLQNIPSKNIETPNPAVAGPALEALKYTGQDKTLREMYANLLANALDIDTKNDAHPSFVEIIKQLSPKEALLLLFLSEKTTYPAVCSCMDQQTLRGVWQGFGDSSIVKNRIKNEFVSVCSDHKGHLDVKSALDNYRRLQILDIESSTTQEIKENWMAFVSENGIEKLELEITHTEELFFTSFGMKFIQICVKNKE